MNDIMKFFNIVVLLFLLLFVSCNKIGIKNKPIPVEQVVGMYDYGEGLILDADFTYKFFYIDNDVVKCDTGVWLYQSYKSLKLNYIEIYDIEAQKTNNYIFKYKRSVFYACKHWGKIIITHGYQGDPDGAPALKWYKKIK